MSEDAVEHLLAMAAGCVTEGCPDLAIDYYLLAYRRGVGDIVVDMHEHHCPEAPLGPRWADDAAWIDWANLALYHRAISENRRGLKFFEDLVTRSNDLVLYGRYWVDEVGPRDRTSRVIMPDTYCHILKELARQKVYLELLPKLINILLDGGRWSEARRHSVDHALLLRWSRPR